MSRPRNCRKIAALPSVALFKPAGVPARLLPHSTLSVDEFEAVRLADHQGLYQEQAAQRMGVSRQTFGRILEAARRKIATALVEGLALKIEGGNVEIAEMRTFCCRDCGHSWDEPFGTGRPSECPACKGPNFRRSDSQKSQAGPSIAGRTKCKRCDSQDSSQDRSSGPQDR